MDSNSILKNGTIPQNGMQNRKSKFPKKQKKFLKWKRVGGGFYRQISENAVYFTQTNLYHLALYDKKGGDDCKIHTTQAYNLQTYIFNNIQK